MIEDSNGILIDQLDLNSRRALDLTDERKRVTNFVNNGSGMGVPGAIASDMEPKNFQTNCRINKFEGASTVDQVRVR